MSSKPDWNQVPRVPETGPLDQATFASFQEEQEGPFVLRGQTDHWPLVQAGRNSDNAFREMLLSAFNANPVRYFEGPESMAGRFFYSDDLLGFNFERKEAPFPEFLGQLGEASTSAPGGYRYAGAIPVPEHAPELMRTHHHGLLPENTEQLVSLWMGNRSRTAAHFDLPQNLACVLKGKRRFILLPIDQMKNLYLGPLDRTLAGQPVSLVDFLSPDLEQHPKFEEALEHAMVADLEPGDVLYMPSLWFHHVETLDDFGAMMNFWWRDAPSYLFTPMITLMHSLLSLRDLPAKERRAWREVFDHYIFQENGDPMAHLPEEAKGIFGAMTPERLHRLKFYLGKSLGQPK